MASEWTSRLSDVHSKRLLVDFRNLNVQNTPTTAQENVNSRQLTHYCEAIDRLVAQGVAADQAAAVMRQCGGDIDAAELWVGSCFAAGLSYISGGTAGEEAAETWVWEDRTGHLYLASSLQEMQAMMHQSACGPGRDMMQVMDMILHGVTQDMQQDMLRLESARQREKNSSGSLTASDILQRLSVASGIQSSRIIAIEEVANPALWTNYSNFKAGMPVANEQWLFHGSGCENIARIVAEGFDLKLANKQGSYGAGIYFSPHSATSHGYATKAALKPNAPWPTTHQCTSQLLKAAQQHGHHVMLLCTVLLGVEGPPSAASHSAPSGSDSVGSTTVKTVYKAAQAYPKYLIAYRQG